MKTELEGASSSSHSPPSLPTKPATHLEHLPGPSRRGQLRMASGGGGAVLLPSATGEEPYRHDMKNAFLQSAPGREGSRAGGESAGTGGAAAARRLQPPSNRPPLPLPSCSGQVPARCVGVCSWLGSCVAAGWGSCRAATRRRRHCAVTTSTPAARLSPHPSHAVAQSDCTLDVKQEVIDVCVTAVERHAGDMEKW